MTNIHYEKDRVLFIVSELNVFNSFISEGFYMLTKEQVQQYHSTGYLVLDELFDANEIGKVIARADKIIREWDDGSKDHIFTTKDNDRTGNDFFLDSAEEIRCLAKTKQ